MGRERKWLGDEVTSTVEPLSDLPSQLYRICVTRQNAIYFSVAITESPPESTSQVQLESPSFPDCKQTPHPELRFCL